jgi:hypothetical protein
MIETDLVVILTIHFPTMSDAENSHALVGIIDFIEDSIQRILRPVPNVPAVQSLRYVPNVYQN